MSEQIKLNMTPVLDTDLLQSVLDSAHPRLKIEIDTSYITGQLQSAVSNLQIPPIQAPVTLNILEKALARIQNPVIPALTKIIPTAGSDTGFFEGIASTGINALNTYTGLTQTVGTLVGLMDGSAVSNFTKSFD